MPKPIRDPTIGVTIAGQAQRIESVPLPTTQVIEQPIEDADAMDGKSFPPVGKCIYCGSTSGLTKEHILPFSLSGTAVLPAASCKTCAAITGATEQIVLRGAFWPVRVHRGLKSRTKHREAPATYPVQAERNGVTQTFDLPIEKLPILLPFPIFDTPRYWQNEQSNGSGINLNGIETYSFGTTLEAAATALGVTNIQISVDARPAEFARMIAKIAYAFAYAHGAQRRLDGEALVLPAILGHTNDIGTWVGTLAKPHEKHPLILHRLAISEETDRGLLCVEVQLFADSGTPSYGVILGKLKN